MEGVLEALRRLPLASAYGEHAKNIFDFLTTAFAHMPQAPSRMRRRPLVAEHRVETTCLRSIVLTGHKGSPDPTLQKARHSQVEPQRTRHQPQPTRNVNIKTNSPHANHVLAILLNATPGTWYIACALTEGGIGRFRPAVADCDSNRFSVFDPFVLRSRRSQFFLVGVFFFLQRVKLSGIGL